MKNYSTEIKDVVRILKDAEVQKLREYSRSYGSPTVIKVPYVLEKEDKILLLNDRGVVQRTMKKGTKVLISWSGKEIKVSTFCAYIQKNQKEYLAKVEEEKKNQEEKQRIDDEKLDRWEVFLRENPEKAKKYYDKCQNFNSKKRCSYIRLKFAQNINNQTFSDFSVSASELLLRLKKVVSENQ
jgi:hypothetical protein